MSRASLPRAIVVIAAALVLAVIFSSGARAATAGDVGGGRLGAAMLGTGDLPAGFQPDAPMTGPLDAQRARELGWNPGDSGSLGAWVRTWRAPDGSEVIETAVDAGTRDHAQAALVSGVAALLKQGATRRSIGGQVRLAAYGAIVEVSGTRYVELALPLARGPYFFGLHVLVPESSAESAGSLMSALAAAQVRKVPAGTPDTAPPDSLAANAAGGATGVLVGYLLGADAIAYLRNPLRRKRGQSRSTRPRAGPGVVDVSGTAKKNFRTAVWRLAVQLTGLTVAAYGADVLLVRYWYAYLVAGLVIVWAGGRFIRPAGVRRDKNRAVLAGSHKILVTGMLTAAAAMILTGLASVVLAGMYQSLPQGDTVPLVPGLAPAPVRDVVSSLEGTAILFVGVGAVIFRGARRVGSIHARRLMLRDPRPPVLYLRAFGDDQLKLWTATFGRPSLIERFTLRRFDSFEEVLVRHLSRYGPVIAVNPPGTRLAPLGAARETIDSADWHPAVAGWMAQARLIVFAAPPHQVTRGLQWELQTVAAHGYWDKTLVAVPPVRADQLQHRWREFRNAAAGLWPFTVPGPVESPGALVLAFRNGRWDAITADRRSEWSYSAALERALGDPAQPAQSPPARDRPARDRPVRDRPVRDRPARRRGPVTLPVAALIVVLAGAMGGAGSWYALRAAPAAHPSAIDAPSGSAPSSPPPSPPQLADGSSSVPASSPSPAALVSMAPAAAAHPGAAALLVVITEYFRAINDRDYQGYLTTQSPGRALTAGQFQTGFRSTADSDILVTGIATAPDGRLAADVTFTSRQQPQDGPDGQSCTNWRVTMSFDDNGGTYTIGAPAAGYQASFHAC